MDFHLRFWWLFFWQHADRQRQFYHSYPRHHCGVAAPRGVGIDDAPSEEEKAERTIE